MVTSNVLASWPLAFSVSRMGRMDRKFDIFFLLFFFFFFLVNKIWYQMYSKLISFVKKKSWYLNSGLELNLFKELGLHSICCIVGLDCIGLTVTALWQLYARGNVWIANAKWIASIDKKESKGFEGIWKLSINYRLYLEN